MSDENNVLNVKDLFGKFKSISELKTYSKDLFLKLQISIKRLKEQESEITHLRSLLVTSTHFDIIPSEQLTCEMEIRRIEESAKVRPLTLEEAKIFDIMTKNLLAIKKARLEEKRPLKIIEEDEITLLSIVKNEQTK